MWYRTQQSVPGAAMGFLFLVLAGCAVNGDDTTGNSAVQSGMPAGAGAMPAGTADTAEGAAPSAAGNQIVIDNFSFNPPRLTVTAGTQVTWVNHDDVPHTVTHSVKPMLFNSGTMDSDDRFSHVFKTPGTYDYFCVLHPRMTAQIVVK